MAYTYDPIFATDPNNTENVAANASIIIFDPADETMAPITITDVTGAALPNPITVSKNGFGPAFVASIERVGWHGGSFTGYFTSYEGIKAAAVAAQVAAENAGASAGAAATASLAEAVADADSAAAAAAASEAAAATSAALVGAPADSAVQTLINAPASATRGALNATYVSYLSLAGNPDALIVGAITRDGNGAATGAGVVWPDGSVGTYAGTPSAGTPGAIDSYTITYGSPVTKTYTQPTVTRNASGAVITRPAITVA